MSLRKALGALLGGALLLGGCATSFEASTTQQLPRLSKEELPESARLNIDRGYTSFPNWLKLRNTARFVVVTRDRLRAYVKLAHPWEDWANPVGWKVFLWAGGTRYAPVDASVRAHKPIYYKYETQQHRAVLNHHGDPVWVGAIPIATMDHNYDAWSGEASFDFYNPDILLGVDRVVLILERGATRYTFTWRITD